jgi:hypothetical protein
MRVEKSGVGDSTGPPCVLSGFHEEAAGFEAALRALVALPYVRKDDVFVFGHSMGGIEAPLLASRVPVRGIVVVGTTSKTYFEYELENQRRQSALDGDSAAAIDSEMHLHEYCMARLLLAKESADSIVAQRPGCRDEFTEFPVTVRYMQEVSDLNAPAVWRHVEAPILILHGSADYITSAADHQLMQTLWNGMHPGKATYAEVANLDHFMQIESSQQASFDDEQRGRIRPFNPAIVEAMLPWLRAHAH